MPKIIPFYTEITNPSATMLMVELRDDPKADVDIRMNSGGGYVASGAGLIWAMRDHVGTIKVFVDGSAMSMAGIMLMFADEVIVSTFSNLMFHQAYLPSYFDPSEAQKKDLENVNELHQAVLRKKIPDTPKGRKFLASYAAGEDVLLTPQEALALNLAHKVEKLTPTASVYIEREAATIQRIAACSHRTPDNKPIEAHKNNHKEEKIMTIEQLKAEYPEMYAQAVAEGSTQSKKTLEDAVLQAQQAEQLRMTALSEKMDILPEMVKEYIAKGQTIDPAFHKAEAEAWKVKALGNATQVSADGVVDPATQEDDQKKNAEPTMDAGAVAYHRRTLKAQNLSPEEIEEAIQNLKK